jgi:flagellar biogenesis protein FliO
VNSTRAKPATCAAFLALSAVASTAGEAVGPAVTPLPDMGLSLLRVSGALAFVLAVFFGGVWLFRNWHRFTSARGRTPKLSVLEVRPLGNRHALYVVGYEEQRLLLSASPAGVTLLTQLPPGKEDAAATVREPKQARDSFSGILQEMLSTR